MSKKAIILHAMEMDSTGHWYPWLKKQLETKGFEVWVPDLPNTNHPDSEEVVDMFLASGWIFNDNLLIGHSSGSVQLLHLLQNLKEQIAGTAIMVSSFDHPLPGMEDQHSKLFLKPFDFKKIKLQCKQRIFFHAADDPWCPVSGPQSLSKLADGELIVLPEGGHFSTSLDPKYIEFPELLKLLKDKSLI